ncbi:MAG TPA: hypothetical protein VGF14_07405 [Alphaproteobacteria bacterium]
MSYMPSLSATAEPLAWNDACAIMHHTYQYIQSQDSLRDAYAYYESHHTDGMHIERDSLSEQDEYAIILRKIMPFAEKGYHPAQKMLKTAESNTLNIMWFKQLPSLAYLISPNNKNISYHTRELGGMMHVMASNMMNILEQKPDDIIALQEQHGVSIADVARVRDDAIVARPSSVWQAFIDAANPHRAWIKERYNQYLTDYMCCSEDLGVMRRSSFFTKSRTDPDGPTEILTVS